MLWSLVHVSGVVVYTLSSYFVCNLIYNDQEPTTVGQYCQYMK